MTANPLGGAVAQCTALVHSLVPDPRVRFWGATILKLVALPLLMLLCLFVYANSLSLFTQIIPLPVSAGLMRVYGAIFAQEFLSACVMVLVFCYPLAKLYRGFAVGVAVLVGLPVLALIRPLPSDYSAIQHLIPAVYRILCFAVPLILGTWLARAQLLRRAKEEAACNGRAAR